MTAEELQDIEAIAYGKDPWNARLRLQQYLKTVSVVENTPKNDPEGIQEVTKGTWTGSQRNASWLYITHKADQLNLAGLDMRVVLKPTYNIPWTKENFHDHIWIPIQRALFGTESMRELQKDQPGRIHELIEREIGEKHGLEFVPFPNFDVRMTAMENLKSDAYPQYSGPPTI